MAVRCVVFDLGGVLVDWNPRHLYRKLIPDEAERELFLANVCTMAWHVQHDRGVKFAETTAAKIKEFPHREALIRAWDERWPEFFNGPISDTVAVVKRLSAAGLPIFGMTNWSGEKFPLAREMFDFLALFHDIVVSGDEGVIKPEKAIFDILRGRTGFAAEDTLFVDDSKGNVDAAAGYGFRTHHFKGAAALERDLIVLGVLSAT